MPGESGGKSSQMCKVRETGCLAAAVARVFEAEEGQLIAYDVSSWQRKGTESR